MDCGLAVRRICIWIDEFGVDDLVDNLQGVNLNDDELFEKAKKLPEVMMMWHHEMTVEWINDRKEKLLKILSEEELNSLLEKDTCSPELYKKLTIMRLYLSN